jgi:hypothetical protein
VHRNRKLIAATAIVVALTGGSARALQDADLDEAKPAVYELTLVYVFETPEPEFVVGNSGFKSVASLKLFIASLPPGITLRWNPGCVRLGGEPLLSSESEMADFRAFCLEHQIDFVLVPSG